jgi:hypothetical protein
MAKILDRDNHILTLEEDLATLKIVREIFPNVQLKLDTSNNSYVFADKSVNRLFNSFELFNYSSEVRLSVEYLIKFEHAGKEKVVSVGCVPKSCLLLRVTGQTYDNNVQDIYYHKSIFKSRDKNIQHKLSSACNLHVIETIKKHPQAKLHRDTFPEKLKKLLIFA